MMASIEITEEYGYVVLVFVASYLLLMYLGILVGMARKKYEVKVRFIDSDITDNALLPIPAQTSHQSLEIKINWQINYLRLR